MVVDVGLPSPMEAPVSAVVGTGTGKPRPTRPTMLLQKRRIQVVLDQAIDGNDKIFYFIHEGDPSVMSPICLVVQIR